MDSHIVANYTSDDSGKSTDAGALPPAKKLQGYPNKRKLRGLKRGMPDLQSGCPPKDGSGVK